MDQDETKVKKMKYILYRSFGDLDKDIKKHELVAVEIGGSIDEVTNALIKDVAEDLAEMPEYAHCEIAAYATTLLTLDHRTIACSVLHNHNNHPKNWGCIQRDRLDC